MTKPEKVFVAIISHARTDNVPKMQTLVGHDVHWFVGKGEGEAYQKAGARSVIESGGLCESRNSALFHAFVRGETCVQLSDDCRKFEFAVWDPAKDKHVAEPASFKQVLVRTLKALDRTGALLAGAAPTANPFYANAKKPIHPSAFIVGDFIVVRPTNLRFDEKLKLKEDYDYTLQHITSHGCVARCDDVLAHFVHRSNPGGAVEYRTAEREQQAIAYLKAKWPQFIADNPRRPNEILLKLPKVERYA